MKGGRLVGVVFALVVVEAMLAYSWEMMRYAENCGNGVDRWECNGTLTDAVGVAVFVVPVATLVVAVRIARRRSHGVRHSL